MRSGLLSELVDIGYEIFLEEDHVKLRYKKSGSPPDSARSLIDELRTCKTEVANILSTGNNTIAPTEKTQPVANKTAMWRNPYPQTTPEARQESLQHVMMATWETAWEGAMKRQPQGYELTKLVLEAEDNVTVTYHRVLSDEALLADFQQAVERWTLTIMNAPYKH